MAVTPISSRNRVPLPAPRELKRLCQSLAMLDAIVCPDWQSRYCSFRADWSEDASLASLRTGTGDEYFVLFGSTGAVIKGFAHESPMASYSLTHGTPWPGVVSAAPAPLADLLANPALSLRDTTFCLWRGQDDPEWSIGPISFPPGADPDGSASLLFLLDGDPATYLSWAQEYYETRLDENAVARIYEHEPLTNDLTGLLSPRASLHSLANDLEDIGYPRI